jgi:cellulose synthase/poly-beta-1,6-N-acetylglucosamine synthase-like glycosyltransferase
MEQMLFWGSLALIVYTYFGFPLLLLIRGLLVRRPIKEANYKPEVSIIIVAHNEVDTIGAKLENMISLEYPRDQMEIIVASDGSFDGTNEIIKSYSHHGVKLLALPRQGKIPALNTAVGQASGEILVFSDANSIYKLDALSNLLRPFADPKVGAVGGNQVYIKSGGGNVAAFGEGLYWNYDRLLKKMQSVSGNMTSATGAIHAIRRELFKPIPLSASDDLVISTRAISQGFRLAFAQNAIAYETIAPTEEAEFNRKVRVTVRALRAVWAVKELLNPFRYGFYSIQIFSHKLLRWSIGWLIIILFIASLSLFQDGIFYKLFLGGQAAFYSIALVALLFRQSRISQQKIPKLLSIPFYFCLANAAASVAWLQLMRGKRVDVWDSERYIGEMYKTVE